MIAPDSGRPGSLTPAEAWARLRAGNARFVAGQVRHPSQNVERRAELALEQHPYVVLLGCSDSRVSAEIVFDQGLGDLFVVRTAGHVLDTTVIGSIEYGINVLGAPLVVVLGHDRCGAVAAARDSILTATMPTGFVHSVVERVIPSLLSSAEHGDAAPTGAGGAGERHLDLPDDDELRRRHVRATVHKLLDYSSALAEAVGSGRCAVVGLEYTLAEGTAGVVESVGRID